MSNLLFGRFKVGEVVKFTPRGPREWAAPQGALAIVVGRDCEFLDVQWVRSPPHNQMNGGYSPNDFISNELIKLEDLL